MRQIVFHRVLQILGSALTINIFALILVIQLNMEIQLQEFAQVVILVAKRVLEVSSIIALPVFLATFSI